VNDRRKHLNQNVVLLSCGEGLTCRACMKLCQRVQRHLDVGTFAADHQDIGQARKHAGKARKLLDGLGLSHPQEDSCVMVGGHRLGTNRLLKRLL